MYFLFILCFAPFVKSTFHHALITEFTLREHVNAMVLFQCNQSDFMMLYNNLRRTFLGSIQCFAIDSSRFYLNHQRSMRVQHYRLGIVVDLGCPQVDQLMEFCCGQTYFNASYRWLLFARDGLNESLDMLEDQNINIDTRMTLAVPVHEMETEQHELYEVYGTIHRRGGTIHAEQVGTWSLATGVRWTSSTNCYQKRKDLQGIQLWSVISTLDVAKNVTLEEYLQTLDQPRWYSSDRFGYRISELLRHHLNFRIKYIIAKGWSLNVIGTNSTSGVIGQLQNNLVDFSSTPLGLGTERVGSFDQTVPMNAGKFLTLFRHPKYGISRNIILHPFQNLLWMSILAILSAAAIILLIAFWVERRTDSISNCQFLLAVLGFFCQQGYSGTTSITSSRITIITLVLFSVMVYQIYSTFIISYLLILPTKNMKTLEHLLASNLKYSIENLAYNHDFFNRTKDPTILELYNRKVLPNKYGFVNVSTGIALVKRGGYAFHCDTSYGNTWIMDNFNEQELCELQEIILYPFRPLHIVVPKGSPLKEAFRVSLRLMLQTGVSEYYKRKFFIQRPRCTNKNFASDKVDLRELTSIYWILVGGIMMGCVVLIAEMVEFRVRTFLEMRNFLRQHPVWQN